MHSVIKLGLVSLGNRLLLNHSPMIPDLSPKVCLHFTFDGFSLGLFSIPHPLFDGGYRLIRVQGMRGVF